MLNIGLTISATPFKDKWPCIKIYHNGSLINDVECQASTKLEYQVVPEKHNVLTVEFYNKSFGDNGVWDVGSDGSGLVVQILDITLDGVSIEQLIGTTEFTTRWTDNQLTYESEDFKSKYNKYNSNGMLNFNGQLNFKFDSPVYEFLIDKKYRVPYDTNELSFYSNKTELFNYELGLLKVEEIKKIIRENQ